jgi:hypothetical protein
MSLPLRPIARSLCLLAAIAAVSGCNVIGVIAGKTAGQVPVEAVYTPDPLVPLVVLVENYRSDSGGTDSDADRVAQMIGARFAEQNVAPIIGQDKVRALRDREPKAYHAMGVVQVARAVGAGQALYVDLTGVAVGTQMGSDVAKGIASANVKFIDAQSGLVAYPADFTDGAPIGYETRVRRVADGVTIDSIRADVLAGLSDRIARMFFRYKPDDLEALDTEAGGVK